MNFNKMMVALDFSSMDKNLISYSHFLAQICGGKTVEFVHVVPSFVPPRLSNSDLEELMEQALEFKESTSKKLAEKVRASFDSLKEVKAELSVLDGKPQEELLQAVQRTKPDLLILGKKQISDGSGVSAHRVARKVDTAIWFVTKEANMEIQNILVPIDFSDNSFRAFKAALYLKQQLNGASITALHVIDIPMTAYKINRNKDAIVAEIKTSATNKFLRYLSQNQIDRTDIKFHIEINEAFDVARYVHSVAAQEPADLIIIGGKGSSLLNNFLFGSVTEKLVTYEYTTPILVIR
jgi:nucleotide-binding universal stress UspA family protein